MINTRNQSLEILKTNKLTLTELAGRTCYNSEHKMHNNSASQFVKNIVNSGHLSVIEHYTVCFKIFDAKLFKFLKQQKFINCSEIHASGNLRAFYELNHPIINKMLHQIEPNIFNDTSIQKLEYYLSIEENDSDLHKYLSVRIVCDRGISHEICRHRNNMAISQSSQRYIKYDENIEFIIQLGIETFEQRQSWIYACSIAQEIYLSLLQSGLKPEWSRSVLPNCTATTLILTANIQQWKHILKLRCSKAAHPQIAALFDPLKKELKL